MASSTWPREFVSQPKDFKVSGIIAGDGTLVIRPVEVPVAEFMFINRTNG